SKRNAAGASPTAMVRCPAPSKTPRRSSRVDGSSSTISSVAPPVCWVLRADIRGKLKTFGLCLYSTRFKTGIKDSRTKRELRDSEEHTSELQSRFDLVCRLLLEKKKKKK